MTSLKRNEFSSSIKMRSDTNIILEIPTDILLNLLRYWLSFRDIVKLDTALLNRANREVWLMSLRGVVTTQATVNIREKELLKLRWLHCRQSYCSKVAFRACKLRDPPFASDIRLFWNGMAKYLKCLRFKDRCSVPSALMMELIVACPQLEELCICSDRIAPAFDGTCLRQVAIVGRNLKVLVLSELKDVTVHDWVYLIESCPNLQELNLENALFPPEVVPLLLDSMPQLSKLMLKSCKLPKPVNSLESSSSSKFQILDDVESLSTSRPFTSGLSDPVIMDDAVSDLPRQNRNDNILRAKLTMIDDLASLPISLHRNMYSLDLSQSPEIASTVFPYFIRRCSMMERLNVSFCNIVSDMFRLVGHGLKRLRTLFMPGCSIHDSSLVMLVSNCPLIETLILGYSPGLGPVICEAMAKHLLNLKTFALWGNELAFTSKSMETFATACRKIDKIALTHTTIDDDALSVLVQHCKISRIEINGCLRLTDRWMSDLSLHCASHLTHFVAEQVNLSEEGIQHLARCDKLEYVNLSKCTRITNASLSILLQSCPRISVLRLKLCSWVDNNTLSLIGDYGHRVNELDVSGNLNITAEGVLSIIENSKHLHRLTALNCVHLGLSEFADHERLRTAALSRRIALID
jgi:hypothetical protein